MVENIIGRFIVSHHCLKDKARINTQWQQLCSCISKTISNGKRKRRRSYLGKPNKAQKNMKETFKHDGWISSGVDT